MGILDDDVAQVREATDIVGLVSERLALKRVGRRFVGLCPFHTEKSPSFSVNPELGLYYCFGCQESGDAITFVRKLDGLDFPEAVERLAARAGITLRYDSTGSLAGPANARRGSPRRSGRRSTSTTASCSSSRPAVARAGTCAVAASTVTRRGSSCSAGHPTASTG